MRFKRLDLNLLVALDNLLALQSVSAAAARMNMSQSAMSNALTRLRTYFNDPLLVQVGRRMELTPRAVSMQAAVRDILVRIEATIETAPEFDPVNTDREFSILLSDYSLTVLMPRVLALAEEMGANVRFRLLPQTAYPYKLLEKGEADLLISPEFYVSDDHPYERLFTDPYVCVVCRDSALAGKEITREVYAATGHAVMVPPNSAGSLEAEMLARLGIERRIDVSAFSFSALPNLIVGTEKIATVHRHIARIAAQTLPLEIHPLPFKLDPLTQAMQWHSYRDGDPGLVWLRDLIVRAAQTLEGSGDAVPLANPIDVLNTVDP
ncbi:LysR family transcriptional regulator [Tropicibacter naphthalenivorans]|uniref:Nodulation protein D 2 n=1 Tax=Tropicibacter naphthalenivorans TaxID=441103 RepID=A0A0P1GY49_9RHOB|nr:LysR family transcriptional regulator [Tropicibacter naphthalenivorans]CUH82198.1 Nodulation protein D 2 [Tropicibacter naphthalenivorans]SMD04942.1 transcriptional regulator, LysR family [Tropicibacter naphthalenivorans]